MITAQHVQFGKHVDIALKRVTGIPELWGDLRRAMDRATGDTVTISTRNRSALARASSVIELIDEKPKVTYVFGNTGKPKAIEFKFETPQDAAAFDWMRSLLVGT